MKHMMQVIVDRCLEKHGGGENYFDELDGMIKDNSQLMASFIKYIVQKEHCSNIIVSGEIGQKFRKLQKIKLIPPAINIICVNGGLRKGQEINNSTLQNFEDHEYVFVDDSFYSGKTATKISDAVLGNGGKIIKTYVFYDGCPIKHNDIESLYRYYD